MNFALIPPSIAFSDYSSLSFPLKPIMLFISFLPGGPRVVDICNYKPHELNIEIMPDKIIVKYLNHRTCAADQHCLQTIETIRLTDCLRPSNHSFIEDR